jgi:hypothetical protein
MAKCQYNPDSGHNSHPCVSTMTTEALQLGAEWLAADTAYIAVDAAPGLASVSAMKAVSSTTIAPNN